MTTNTLLIPPPSLAPLPGAALVVNTRGRVCGSNTYATTMFGADPKGQLVTELLPDPSRLIRAVDGLRPGDMVPRIPLEGRRANGVPFALDMHVRVLTGGDLLCQLREIDRRSAGLLDAAFTALPTP